MIQVFSAVGGGHDDACFAGADQYPVFLIKKMNVKKGDLAFPDILAGNPAQSMSHERPPLSV